MPNKPWKELNPLDQLIQRTLRLGMSDGTFLKIEYIYGFEKFNTRPYHNYETWAGGYRVTDEHNGITLEREDLDDALNAWAKKAAPIIDARYDAEKQRRCITILAGSSNGRTPDSESGN